MQRPISQHRARALTMVLALGLLLPGPAVAQGPRDPGLDRLQTAIASLEPSSGGLVGVAAVHLETGRAIYFRRGERFPMASTFKVPVAVQVLSRVDRREVRLDSMVTLQPTDLHPGSGTLTHLFDKPGVALSVRNLLELMLLISDNTAADLMLRTAGGPAAVDARLAALGVQGVRVDRPTSLLIADWLGVEGLPPSGEVTTEAFRAAAQRDTTAAHRKAANEAFDRDPRDTATPEGMADLLQKIWRGQALSPASTQLLLDIMSRCETGKNRLRGMLPPGTVVMDKTGSIGGTVNDVGILTLPQDAGHVVIAVFIKESTAPEPRREQAIAQIARSVYDYFLFTPGAGTQAATP